MLMGNRSLLKEDSYFRASSGMIAQTLLVVVVVVVVVVAAVVVYMHDELRQGKITGTTDTRPRCLWCSSWGLQCRFLVKELQTK